MADQIWELEKFPYLKRKGNLNLMVNQGKLKDANHAVEWCNLCFVGIKRRTEKGNVHQNTLTKGAMNAKER